MRERDRPRCHLPILPESDEEILSQYRARAEKNDPRAIWNLATCYKEGNFGCPVDFGKALELYERGVDLSSADACYDLGSFYWDGDHGLPQDDEKARMYFKKAAIAGDSYARSNLGTLEWHHGNFSLAIRHWRIAAAAGMKSVVVVSSRSSRSNGFLQLRPDLLLDVSASLA